MLGMRLTQCQQIHPDTAPAAQQMFTSLFIYLLEPQYLVPIKFSKIYIEGNGFDKSNHL